MLIPMLILCVSNLNVIGLKFTNQKTLSTADLFGLLRRDDLSKLPDDKLDQITEIVDELIRHANGTLKDLKENIESTRKVKKRKQDEYGAAKEKRLKVELDLSTQVGDLKIKENIANASLVAATSSYLDAVNRYKNEDVEAAIKSLHWIKSLIAKLKTGTHYPTVRPTSVPPTPVPTTYAPTPVPTTLSPTTYAPTPVPTTLSPTTLAPTPAPTTLAPTPAPTTLANQWILVFRQTVPYFAPPNTWLHKGLSTDPNYSILDELENFRSADGKLKFKIIWPRRTSKTRYNIWKQKSNPVTANPGDPVIGYEDVDIQFRRSTWGGLERSTSGATLLDGSVQHTHYWFSIGAAYDHFGGIPGAFDVESQTELWIMKEE